ncbi:hypothetical protein ASH02_05840 [Nocardioides sp. Soil796]|nr:hypothetical protein ASH02_05840 [Nocardioides sp. Soil796]
MIWIGTPTNDGPAPSSRPTPRNPARDTRGRLLDVEADASPEEIAAAVVRRDEADTRNLAELRRLGRLGNGW